MKASQARNNHFQEQFEESQANFSDNMNNGDTGDDRSNQGQPIQLIKIKQAGKIQINPSALDIIASCDLPVGFVSLVGKSRTGKSFLLNKLLNLDGPGFRVDPSTKACTEGIWMWSEPFFNKELGNYIFFIDTEGTDSLIRDSENDTKIFTLATLISSYFMFNSVGVIDQRSLSEIEMITALSKQIKADQKLSDRDNQQALYQFMPKFLWILRDFTLKLEDDKFRKITPKQYLQNCLNDQNSRGGINQQSRKVKKSIMNYFKSRDCIVLVRPVGQQYDLHRLNSIPPHALRRQFLDGVSNLREKITANASAKLYEGQPLTGYAITSMIESYVDAFNSGKTPSIKNAWQQISQDEGVNAYNKALDKYNELFNKSFPDDEPKGPQIHKILADIRQETMRQFQANTDQRNDEYSKKLKDFLDQKSTQTININDDLNEIKDNQILKKHAQKLRNKLQRGDYASNKEQLTKDIDDVMDNYKRDAKGARKGEILADFYKTLTPIISSIQQNTQSQSNQAELQIKMQEMERKLKLKQQQAESMKKRLESNQNVANIKAGKVGKTLPDKNSKKQNEGPKKTGCCGGECRVM